MCAARAGVAQWEHELRLRVEPGSARLAAAELAPPDVGVSGVEAAAKTGARPLAFVVREVHALLAAHLNAAAATSDQGGSSEQHRFASASICNPGPPETTCNLRLLAERFELRKS